MSVSENLSLSKFAKPNSSLRKKDKSNRNKKTAKSDGGVWVRFGEVQVGFGSYVIQTSSPRRG